MIPKGKTFARAMGKLTEVDKDLLKVSRGHDVAAIRYFISKGASANTLDEYRTSPLHIASRSGNIQIVEELLNSGANVNITDQGGWTPLHIASYFKHNHICALLLKFGANPTIQTSKK